MIFFFSLGIILTSFFGFSAMYATIYGHQLDPNIVIDMIFTGFIQIDTSTARMFVEDDAYHNSSPETLMLFS